MRVHPNTLAAVGLAALTLAAPALADPGHGPGGNGAGRFGQVSGTITAIGTNTLSVKSATGTTTVLTIASGTTIIGTQTITAAAIALGDTLLVSGIPVSLQAAAIIDDKLPAPPSPPSAPSPPTGTTSTTETAPVPGTLRVLGVVTALSPPTITVDNAFSLTLSLTSATTFSEVSTLTLSQLATGETVSAQVMTKGTTTTATEIDVTP